MGYLHEKRMKKEKIKKNKKTIVCVKIYMLPCIVMLSLGQGMRKGTWMIKKKLNQDGK